VDEELRRLRREHAAGAGVEGELVRALARARLDDEVVAAHGARTRAGGEVGAIVERAWETALERLERQVVPGPPVFVGSEVVAIAGELIALVVSYRLQVVHLLDAAPSTPRAVRGCARVDGGLLVLEADGRRLTRLTSTDPVVVSRSVGARVGCGRTCACTNRETSGDPDVPGPLLCWHERMAIPLADRAAGALFAARDPTFLRRFYGAPSATEVVHA